MNRNSFDNKRDNSTRRFIEENTWKRKNITDANLMMLVLSALKKECFLGPQKFENLEDIKMKIGFEEKTFAEMSRLNGLSE